MTTVEATVGRGLHSLFEDRGMSEVQTVAKDKILDVADEFLEKAHHARVARVKSIKKASDRILKEVLTFRTQSETYLHALKKTRVTAFITMLATTVICNAAIFDMVAFVNKGANLLDPYLSLLLALGSLFLFIVSVASIVVSNRRLERFLWEILSKKYSP